jgi:hypothetical protein
MNLVLESFFIKCPFFIQTFPFVLKKFTKFHYNLLINIPWMVKQSIRENNEEKISLQFHQVQSISLGFNIFQTNYLILL